MLTAQRRRRLTKLILRHSYGIVDRLAEKAELALSIQALEKGGKVQLVVWQMDCDCASWTSGIVVNATVAHVQATLNDIYNNAEGPVRWNLASPDFKVERNERDHALEAHEDGHPHSVSY
jgi:hypothetical protein